MLYPSREDLPGYVPAGRITDCDGFAVDAPDGDFAGAMVRQRNMASARLVWAQRNGGHWLAPDGEQIRQILGRPRQQQAIFGAGPHFCLGSMLACAEILIFLEEWLARIPDFAIDPGVKLEVKVGAAAAIPYLPLVWTPCAASARARAKQEQS